MSDRSSWCCGGCGAWNAPHQDVCGSCCGAAASSSKAPQQVVAGKKAVASKTSTTKSRYDYKDPDFQQFWEVYPLKRGKAAAYRKFVAAVAAGVEAHRIIEAAAAYRDDPSRDPAFTKWPEGWLNAGRWDDETEVVRPLSVAPDPATVVGTPEWQAAQDAEYDRLRAEDA